MFHRTESLGHVGNQLVIHDVVLILGDIAVIAGLLLGHQIVIGGLEILFADGYGIRYRGAQLILNNLGGGVIQCLLLAVALRFHIIQGLLAGFFLGVIVGLKGLGQAFQGVVVFGVGILLGLSLFLLGKGGKAQLFRLGPEHRILNQQVQNILFELLLKLFVAGSIETGVHIRVIVIKLHGLALENLLVPNLGHHFVVIHFPVHADHATAAQQQNAGQRKRQHFPQFRHRSTLPFTHACSKTNYV